MVVAISFGEFVADLMLAIISGLFEAPFNTVFYRIPYVHTIINYNNVFVI